MVGEAELDVPATDASGPCPLHHIRGLAGRPSRYFRLSSLLPSSLMYTCLILRLTFLLAFPDPPFCTAELFLFWPAPPPPSVWFRLYWSGQRGGGVGTRPRYLIVCLWRRPLASRHCSF